LSDLDYLEGAQECTGDTTYKSDLQNPDLKVLFLTIFVGFHPFYLALK
jgi:hypothetical protein